MSRLHSRLNSVEWTDIEEIPAAIDLWARRHDGRRVIFEAKTLEGDESHQLRSALAQLLEYRYFYGENDDLLCIVTDRPIADRLTPFLQDCGVVVAWLEEDKLKPAGSATSAVIGDLLQ